MNPSNLKSLSVGKCYINEDGSFIIYIIEDSEKHGYYVAASHVNPSIVLGLIHIQTIVVEDDGHWIEIPPEVFNMASSLHSKGLIIKIPADKWRGSGVKYTSSGEWDRLSYTKLWAKHPPSISSWI